MSLPILSVKHISFGYRSKQPLFQDATFDLARGRITAILGANGVGKTTLLSLTLGWLPVWTGRICFAGVPINSLSPRERGRRMALVPQSEHTPFDYSLLEYTLMGRAPHLPPLGAPTHTDIEIALHALEEVGLLGLENRAVPQLSGGERQLMLLARALTQLSDINRRKEGALLVLDEPTSHLDLRNKAHFIEILRSLKESGVTLLMTNHEPDIVLALADDVLLVESGSALTFGRMDEVFTEDALSHIYGHPVRLVKVDGRRRALWL